MTSIDKKKFIIYFFTILVLFIIPVYVITSNTDTLMDGTEYKFRVEGYDPYDMLRGNYINISFKEKNVVYWVKAGESYPENYSKETYYFAIGEDINGFAYFKYASKVKPDTDNYYEAKATYSNWRNELNAEKKLIIDTPTRYYINEKKSTNISNTYNENTDNTYAKVRVKNGKMVIVGIYVNDRLIDSID